MAGSVQYVLEKVCDISKSETIHEQLEAFLNGGSEIDIDASQVERMDTSVMQTLVSLSKTLEQRHMSVSIINPSKNFIATVELLGVAEHLNVIS